MDDDPIASAQKRLIDACMRQRMKPEAFSISAYINTTLLSAQVAALVEYTQPFELNELGEPIMKGTFPELFVKHLNARAALFENAQTEAPRMQIVGNA